MRVDRLKALRDAKGLTQAQLGALIGKSQQSIDHYEKSRAQMDDDTLVKVAMVLNTSIDYLLGSTDNPSPPGESVIDDQAPEVANVLRRCGRPLTPEERRRIARIMEAAIEVTEDDV